MKEAKKKKLNDLLTEFYKEIESRESKLSDKQIGLICFWSMFHKKRLRRVMQNVVDGMHYNAAFKNHDREICEEE